MAAKPVANFEGNREYDGAPLHSYLKFNGYVFNECGLAIIMDGHQSANTIGRVSECELMDLISMEMVRNRMIDDMRYDSCTDLLYFEQVGYYLRPICDAFSCHDDQEVG